MLALFILGWHSATSSWSRWGPAACGWVLRSESKEHSRRWRASAGLYSPGVSANAAPIPSGRKSINCRL